MEGTHLVTQMVTELVSDLEQKMASVIHCERKLIDWACLFQGDPRGLIGSSAFWFTVFV